jgi:hypothetical protein
MVLMLVSGFKAELLRAKGLLAGQELINVNRHYEQIVIFASAILHMVFQ